MRTYLLSLRPLSVGSHALRLAALAALAGVVMLTGCGGGGTADVSVGASAAVPAPVQIGVAGTAASYAPVESGQAVDVVANVGQPVTFDANEPVVWTFAVNGSPLFANGAIVDVDGVEIQQVQVDPTRAVIASSFYGNALLPVDVLLTATSTIDAAQVATVRLHLQ